MKRWQQTRCAAVLLAAGALAPAMGATLGESGGSGPWPATAASTPQLPGHTLYHPVQLPAQALPLYVWGNGGCANNGFAHAAYLREIASRGYFIVSLGEPREPAPRAGGAPPGVAPGPSPRGAAPGAAPPPAGAPAPRTTADPTQPAQMLEAIAWATRENASADGPFRGRIDLTRVAVGGHSCGGLQALSVSTDPRIRTTLVLNSGIYNQPGGRSGVQIDKSQLERLHAPLLYLSGGPEDIAHANAVDDVQRIARLPVFFGALSVGHGGTFSQANGGEWARVTTRWLDWQLKGDADAGRDFSGEICRLCTDARWTVVRKNMPQAAAAAP